jgi:hypothetical protein
LAGHAGRVVPSAALNRHIWGDAPVTVGRVSRLVVATRDRLTAAGGDPEWLFAIRSWREQFGYRLDAATAKPEPENGLVIDHSGLRAWLNGGPIPQLSPSEFTLLEELEEDVLPRSDRDPTLIGALRRKLGDRARIVSGKRHCHLEW